MSFKRAIGLALTLVAALPAVASAQEQIVPPRGDNYLQPVFLNDEDAPFPSDPIGILADTTNYTLQQDMFNPPASGGPAEPTLCGEQNTIWSVFYSNRYGAMNISTAGSFDGVIAVVPFESPDSPEPIFDERAFCTDNLAGLQQDADFLVSPRQWYAVQVGGAGSPAGGQVQVKYDLNPPPRVNGDVVLSWRTNGTQARVKSLVVNAPKGSRVAISCTKRGCGKNPRPFTVKKPAFAKPIALVGPSAKPAGVSMSDADGSATVASDPGTAAVEPFAKRSAGTQVQAAKKYKLLEGRRLKNGSQIVIRIYRAGWIGRHFTYKVKSGAVSSKVARCTNPGSSRPRKRCS